jgi:hypothetical protein
MNEAGYSTTGDVNDLSIISENAGRREGPQARGSRLKAAAAILLIAAIALGCAQKKDEKE